MNCGRMHNKHRSLKQARQQEIFSMFHRATLCFKERKTNMKPRIKSKKKLQEKS